MTTRYIVSRITNYRQANALWTPIGSFDTEAEANAWLTRLTRAVSTFMAALNVDGAFWLPDNDERVIAAYNAVKRLDPSAPQTGLWYAVSSVEDFVAPSEAAPATALEEWYWAASAAES